MSFFKKCPMCGHIWRDIDEFIEDSSVVINGYKANLEYLESGLFYFTHEIEGCFTTMAIEARDFSSLNSQQKYTQRKTLMAECPRYCLDQENLLMCFNECECAHYRDLLGIIMRRKENLSSKISNTEKKDHIPVDMTDHS